MKKNKSGKTALVLWGATDIGPPNFSSDILWRTGFKAPDPFFLIEVLEPECLQKKGKNYLFVSALETGRAGKESSVDEVINSANYKNKVRPAYINFLKELDVGKVIVPSTFSAEIFLILKKYFETLVASDPYYPCRAVKNEWELSEIEKAQLAIEKAVGKATEYLRSCIVADEVIKDIGSPEFGMSSFVVTSEMVRLIIDRSLFNEGYLGVGTIVSGGLQSADPHCMGFGPLRPHQPIVMDVFPLSLKTHYHADMTRTVFKGEPSQEFKNMYEAVRAGQELGVDLVKAGTDGQDIFNAIVNLFNIYGYPTNMISNPPEGFIHGVGHGVGIDIHEPPWISSFKYILEEGNVVTVEPGLYYQKPRAGIHAGGIRIEDMVIVTKDGCRNLTKFPKDLESMIIP